MSVIVKARGAGLGRIAGSVEAIGIVDPRNGAGLKVMTGSGEL